MKNHPNPTVIIIGAGISGLAAANCLRKHHFDVRVLEAKDRIGGRTVTDHNLGFPFDRGAFVIHGTEKNPITKLCREFNMDFAPLSLDSVHFTNAKDIGKKAIHEVHAEFDRLLFKAGELARHLKDDRTLGEAMQTTFDPKLFPALIPKLLSWRSLFLTLFTGAGEKHLSAQHWDENELEFAGGHHLMLNGYTPLIEGLSKEISITLNTTVKKIQYGSAIKVVTDQETYEANLCLVTVPLGVLKSHRITFDPPLPSQKTSAISRLAMGNLDKIVLRFPSLFWPGSSQYISYLAEKYEDIGWFHNFYPYFKIPAIMGVVGGDKALEFAGYDDQTVLDFAMTRLKKLFGNDIPDPIGYDRTNWANDPCALGSYSYIPVGASGQDYEQLAEPLENKLFFCGEATQKEFPGTTHGAYFSGLREARRMIALRKAETP